MTDSGQSKGPEFNMDPVEVRMTELAHHSPPYDPEKGTLYGARAEFEDLDIASLSAHEVLVVFVRGMQKVESCEDQVDGFKQIGRQILVCGRGDGHTAVIGVCWDCKWLSGAHRPDCGWKAVRDVNAF